MAFDHSSRKAGARLSTITGHLAPAVQAPSSVSGNVAAGGKYKYTVDGKVLTKEQREFYEKNGFLVFKRLIPEKDLDSYKSRFIDICTGKAGQGAFFTIMRDVSMDNRKNQWGENSITKLQDWHDDEHLFQYCTHPEVVKIVNDIIGKDCRSIHTMLINKPPDLGLGSSRHPPHQDLWYFPHRPAERIVASWTAMQKIDTTNGCLFVKPGSHRGELLKHEYPNDGIVNKAYHGIQNMTEEDGKKLLMLEMEPGDTVFFHPLLIHGSGRNNSKGYRKAISCHYASADCEFVDAKGTIQEELAKELEDMAKTRMRAFGDVTLSFHDLWKMKSRHVSGKERAWAL